jgi:hypothetical protein
VCTKKKETWEVIAHVVRTRKNEIVEARAHAMRMERKESKEIVG